MKGLSKPISSPSRAEKFPPPLMRFLRSNTGSRSRGRSRSSPMFRMRSRKDAAPVIEPSSPKVTCFGQVQVTTSSTKTTASRRPKNGSSAGAKRPCWWLKKNLVFHKIFSSRFHRRGGLCFGSGFCKKVDATAREDSCRADSNQGTQRNELYDRNCEKVDARIQENKGNFLDSSPPRNALLLTRCRSAPYRSSSLAGQFWGSSLASTKADNDSKIEAKAEHELQKPSCESVMLDLTRNQKYENSVNNVQVSEENAGGAVHPLLLTRCKSEPARTGERLNPDINLN